MESKDRPISGVTIIANEAPSNYHVAPREESSTPASGTSMFSFAQESSTQANGTQPFTLAQESSTHTTGTLPFALSGPSMGMTGSFEKKKRGRPRKYGPDGARGGTSGAVLSPIPISSKPLTESSDFHDLTPGTQPPSGGFSSDKKGKARVNGSEAKQKYRNETDDLGDGLALSTGGTFVPHVLTVNPGEDVSMKIMNLSQQGPRSICIICGSGVISNVTLRQSASSGGTMTFEGRFQILTLTGSFTPTDVGGFHMGRCGGISVSLSSADGRIIGGVLAGLLIAASPVQIIVGSFLPSGYVEPKQKKQKSGHKPPLAAQTSPPIPLYSDNVEHQMFDRNEQSHTDAAAAGTSNGVGSSSASDLNFDDWGVIHSRSDQGRSTTDINIPLQGE